MKKEKLLLDRIKKDIKKAKVVSFDIFDTLLVRPYVKPTDLFLHMEKAFERPGFAEERKDAERRTRIRHKELEDITFDMIYEEIDDEFKDMKQKEMDWEEMVLRANPELKQVYDYAKELGKTIIIASDMYMPTEFLAKVLLKNGFDGWEKLYVSGDLGKKKRTGSMYHQILEDLSIKPKEILHIGDNKVSDYDTPKNLRIKTVLYKQILQQFIEKNRKIGQICRTACGDLSVSILASIQSYNFQLERCNIRKIESYWHKLGYNYAGVVAYGYGRFIEKEAQRNNINNLLFIARDGYTLEKVFHTFNNEIHTTYCYASRFISMVSRFVISDDYMSEIKPVIDFLISTNDDIKKCAEDFSFDSPHSYLIFAQKYQAQVFEAVQNNLKNYTNYLKNKVGNKTNIGIIDTITANFSSQNLVEEVLGRKVLGFYWGILNRNIHNKYNFVMYTPFNNKCIHRRDKTAFVTFTKNWDLMEFLLSSPEYPIKAVSSDGKPVYDNNPNSYEIYRAKIYPDISLGAVAFAQDIKELFNNHDIYLTSDVLIKYVNAYIDKPEKEDIENMYNIQFATVASSSYYYPLFSAKIPLIDLLFKPKKAKIAINKLLWKTKFQKKYISNYWIYREKNDKRKVLKFFGLLIYKKEKIDDIIKCSYLSGLIKIIKKSKKTKIYLLGIKIYKKNKRLSFYDVETLIRKINQNNIDKLSYNVQRALTVANLHQKTFGEFRNKHEGETLALVGAGPTVKFLEPLKNIRYVGLNRAFLLDKIKFDYLFTIDKVGLNTGKEQFYDGFLNYDCIKFIGDQNLGINYQHPQDIMYFDASVRMYKTTAAYMPHKLALDIDTEALANSCSSSIQAMQFILFTNPKRVYIYGVDCTCASKQHFVGGAYNNEQRGEVLSVNDKRHIADWKRIKTFVETYYPKTEIIVVNPVGLKGIFREVYTKSYLHKHPEIDDRNLEILSEEEL